VGIKRRDVQSSLAEMDRKLRELQRELALVTRPANQAAPTQPARPDPDPASTAAPATTPEAPHTVADAEAQAIVADARAEAARIVEEAAAGVAAIAGQIEEFQRLREELQRSATALIEEYERALRRAPSPDAAPEDEATPAPPTSSLALQQQPPVPPPATPPIADGRQFEGQLVINVGPFTDMATLGTFEQALAQLPQTEDVYVRGFEGNRALVDLKLNGPVPLLDELRRVLPFALGLVEIGYGRITIDVELGPEAPR
jgi:hypothetical protein